MASTVVDELDTPSSLRPFATECPTTSSFACSNAAIWAALSKLQLRTAIIRNPSRCRVKSAASAVPMTLRSAHRDPVGIDTSMLTPR
jgi:hypothetical protein